VLASLTVLEEARRRPRTHALQQTAIYSISSLARIFRALHGHLRRLIEGRESRDICAHLPKTKSLNQISIGRAKHRSERRQAGGAIAQQGRQLKRALSYQKYREATMLTALWPWPWPWSKTVTTIANMPNCTAGLVDKPPPLSLCIVICSPA
jgi:hypothetical protein